MTEALVPLETIRVAGHFGEFFQGRLGEDGPVVLVTVPCEALGAEVGVSPGPFRLDGQIDQATAARLLERIGVPEKQFHVKCDAPMGAGAGMSTASLLALARAMGVEPPVETLLAVEGAVDPLMLDAPGRVLWASREARVLRQFAPLPDVTIVGGFWGAPEPTSADDNRFPDVGDLVDFWAEATDRQDRAALAGLATEAARRTTALRGPSNDPTLDLARDLGAMGVVRAHTGSARGLIFAPSKVPAGVGAALQEAGYSGVLQFQTGQGA